MGAHLELWCVGEPGGCKLVPPPLVFRPELGLSCSPCGGSSCMEEEPAAEAAPCELDAGGPAGRFFFWLALLPSPRRLSRPPDGVPLAAGAWPLASDVPAWLASEVVGLGALLPPHHLRSTRRGMQTLSSAQHEDFASAETPAPTQQPATLPARWWAYASPACPAPSPHLGCPGSIAALAGSAPADSPLSLLCLSLLSDHIRVFEATLRSILAPFPSHLLSPTHTPSPHVHACARLRALACRGALPGRRMYTHLCCPSPHWDDPRSESAPALPSKRPMWRSGDGTHGHVTRSSTNPTNSICRCLGDSVWEGATSCLGRGG